MLVRDLMSRLTDQSSNLVARFRGREGLGSAIIQVELFVCSTRSVLFIFDNGSFKILYKSNLDNCLIRLASFIFDNDSFKILYKLSSNKLFGSISNQMSMNLVHEFK